MGLFDSLKNLFGVEADLSSLEKIDIDTDVKLIRDVKDNTLIKIERNVNNNNATNNNLTINIASDFFDKPGNLEALKEITRNQVHQEEQPVMLAETSELARIVDATSTEVDELMKYYLGKIPDSDLSILRAAFYLRAQHSAGKHVDLLKQDIIDTYGKRGANIANLCSAGYFESHITPMYEELSNRPNFTRQTFIDTYNKVVDDAPFALFVSRQHDKDKLAEEIASKISLNKKYGIHQLNIHAIGKDNIKKIQDAITNEAAAEQFTNEPEISIQGQVATYILFY